MKDIIDRFRRGEIGFIISDDNLKNRAVMEVAFPQHVDWVLGLEKGTMVYAKQNSGSRASYGPILVALKKSRPHFTFADGYLTFDDKEDEEDDDEDVLFIRSDTFLVNDTEVLLTYAKLLTKEMDSKVDTNIDRTGRADNILFHSGSQSTTLLSSGTGNKDTLNNNFITTGNPNKISNTLSFWSIVDHDRIAIDNAKRERWYVRFKYNPGLPIQFSVVHKHTNAEVESFIFYTSACELADKLDSRVSIPTIYIDRLKESLVENLRKEGKL